MLISNRKKYTYGHLITTLHVFNTCNSNTIRHIFTVLFMSAKLFFIRKIFACNQRANVGKKFVKKIKNKIRDVGEQPRDHQKFRVFYVYKSIHVRVCLCVCMCVDMYSWDRYFQGRRAILRPTKQPTVSNRMRLFGSVIITIRGHSISS